jgi:hypothetical protein
MSAYGQTTKLPKHLIGDARLTVRLAIWHLLDEIAEGDGVFVVEAVAGTGHIANAATALGPGKRVLGTPWPERSFGPEDLDGLRTATTVVGKYAGRLFDEPEQFEPETIDAYAAAWARALRVRDWLDAESGAS